MKNPEVSVIMPVFNGEKFLKNAIDSILNQTYQKFEFLIINDGSTDDSEKIIKSYTDPRIVYIKNERNLGIVETLNKGINIANGKYIARMDCDDISLSERLEKQVSFLEVNSDYDVIATKIQLIDENGIRKGYWEDDLLTTTYNEIKNYLPKLNCIAHPSVMMRSEIIKEYLYDPKQQKSEDWDLWLRLISEKRKIAKLNEVYLNYRVHNDSITQKSNKKNVYRKIFRLQKNYFIKKLLNNRINSYDLSVLKQLPSSFDKAYLKGRVQKNSKRFLNFFKVKLWRKINSYYRFSKYCSFLLRKKNLGELFFFFPFYHIGGAEKVHINILETIKEKKPWLFITAKSDNKAFYNEFKNNCDHLFFIGDFGKLRTRIIKKFISSNINKSSSAVTFGCNSSFYYNLLSELKANVKCIDLIHAFSGKDYKAAEDWSLPFIEKLQKRIFISKKVIEDLKHQYKEHNIDNKLLERVEYIPNHTTIPASYSPKKSEGPIELLYVGRDSSEKRIYLIFEIARECQRRNIPVSLSMVGSIKSSFSGNSYPIHYTGELNNPEQLSKLYSKAHIVLITSSREGFPMVIMEGMAHGTIPLSTAVGDCPLHIVNYQSGYVIENYSDEGLIVEDFVKYIDEIYRDKELRNRLSQNSYRYAKENFGIESFRKKYRKVLLQSE